MRSLRGQQRFMLSKLRGDPLPMKRYDDEIFPLHHHQLFMVADYLISMLNTCIAPRLTKSRLLGLPKLQPMVRLTGIKMEIPMAM